MTRRTTSVLPTTLDVRKTAWLGVALWLGGIMVAMVAWRSDQLGITFDNRTVDPWQVVGVIVGLVIAAVGVGVVLSAVGSERSTRLQRVLAGMALTATVLGWVATLGAAPVFVDCAATAGCGIGYNFISDWKITVALSAATTLLALWGWWGLHRSNGLSPLGAKAVYWVASIATWVIWVEAAGNTLEVAGNTAARDVLAFVA